MARFTININLKAIPRELIRKVGEDKAYIDLSIGELREIDERGNDLYVQVYIPKDKMQQFPNKVYIGRGRTWQDQPHVGGTPFNQQPAPAPAAGDNPDSDLPFS